MDLHAETQRLSQLIDKGLTTYRQAIEDRAAKADVLRRSKAEAWATVKDEGGRTAEHMKAEVESRTSGDAKGHDMADALVKSAKEALDSRRHQISLLQSLAAADRAEAELAGKGPVMRP